MKRQPSPQTAAADAVANMPLDMVFEYMAIRLDAGRAEGRTIAVNLVFPDVGERHALYLENSVLNDRPGYADKNVDATVTLDRAALNDILGRKTNLEQAIAAGKVRIDGDRSKLTDLMSCLTNPNDSSWFDIVTSNLPARGAHERQWRAPCQPRAATNREPRVCLARARGFRVRSNKELSNMLRKIAIGLAVASSPSAVRR